MSSKTDWDLQDLFVRGSEPSDPEGLPRDRPRPLALSRLPLPSAPLALKLDEQDFELRVLCDDNDGELHITTTLHGLAEAPLDLDGIQILLRDAEGRLLDLAEASPSGRFRRSQELVFECSVGVESLERMDTLEFRVGYRHKARFLGARARLEPLGELKRFPHRDRWPFVLEELPAPPGLRAPRLEVALFEGRAWSPNADLVLLAEDLGGSLSSLELAAALRDEQGAVLARETAWLSDIERGPALCKLRFDAEPAALRQARSLELAFQAEVARRETVALFRVQRGGPSL